MNATNFEPWVFFTFKLELCIDHLKLCTISKTCELDLDLQGQIGLQTCKIFVFKLTYLNFAFTLFIDRLNISLICSLLINHLKRITVPSIIYQISYVLQSKTSLYRIK